MCQPYTIIDKDAANKMATLVATYTAARPTNDQVRRLIRERWDDLRRLAHAIHEEEDRRKRAEADNYSKYAHTR